eukprot:XP_001701561.1 predicted protein [Chlamydomonas reinhardtii]
MLCHDVPTSPPKSYGSKLTHMATSWLAGLAGVTPLSLLPVPLPPIENWQSGGKSVADLDPCKDIRLVDAPRCILPRPTEEQDLQVEGWGQQRALGNMDAFPRRTAYPP